MNGHGKATPAKEPGEASPHKILVVEDEVLLRIAISTHLRDLGYTVVEAGDAAEAMKAVDADASIAVVFTDVHMAGGMDGNELARRIRASHPAVKVLVTSGVGAADRGIPFLAKPYLFSDLQRRIEELLES